MNKPSFLLSFFSLFFLTVGNLSGALEVAPTAVIGKVTFLEASEEKKDSLTFIIWGGEFESTFSLGRDDIRGHIQFLGCGGWGEAFASHFSLCHDILISEDWTLTPYMGVGVEQYKARCLFGTIQTTYTSIPVHFGVNISKNYGPLFDISGDVQCFGGSTEVKNSSKVYGQDPLRRSHHWISQTRITSSSKPFFGISLGARADYHYSNRWTFFLENQCRYATDRHTGRFQSNMTKGGALYDF